MGRWAEASKWWVSEQNNWKTLTSRVIVSLIGGVSNWWVGGLRLVSGVGD